MASEGLARREGYLLCQKTEEVMRGSQAGAALRRLGLGGALRMEQLSKDEVLSLEPNLSPNVRPLCGLGLRVQGLGFRFWESVAMSTNVGFLACCPSSNPKP